MKIKAHNKFADTNQWIVFLDESGDQGKPSIESLLFNDHNPRRQWPKFNGATRYFTVGVIAVHASILGVIEQEYTDKLRKKKEGNERKYSTCSEQSKVEFQKISIDLMQRFPDSFRMGAVTLDKSQIPLNDINRSEMLSPEEKTKIKEEKINLYNRLAREAITRTTCTTFASKGGEIVLSYPKNVTILCDQRPVKREAFDDLRDQTIFEIKTYAGDHKAILHIDCEVVDSKECFMTQMADFLSGMVRQNYERNVEPYCKEILNLVHEKLLIPSEINAHKGRSEFSGSQFSL